MVAKVFSPASRISSHGGLSLRIPWLAPPPAQAGNFGLFDAHILDAGNGAGSGKQDRRNLTQGECGLSA